MRRIITRFRPLLVLGLLVLLVVPSGQVFADQSKSDSTYTNPVSQSFGRNFADPTVIRGRDGFWYAYATNGRLEAGDERHLMMMARSSDLVHWEFLGDVFTPETMPTYDGLGPDANRQFWAPEIAWVDGQYLLYYSYVANTPSDHSWRAIGVAVADHPAGPWRDTGSFVTGPETWEPRPGVTAWRNVIDPEVVAAPDGTRYLYYGSVLGGVRVVRLSADGLKAVGERVQLTPEHRYEAAYVVHRDGWYYLFLSVIGGCCDGPASAYPVVVARSRSPLGPFTDADGNPMAGRHAGGTPVQTPNGNQWVSPGHNAIATDLAGQDWLVTHGTDRNRPYVAGTENARHLMINRLDWIDGWPVARAGAGLPTGPVPGPVNRSFVSDPFEDSELGDGWQQADGWQIHAEQAGGFLRAAAGDRATRLVSSRATGRDVRLRAAVRVSGSTGSAGLVLHSRGSDDGLEARIDPVEGLLRVEARQGFKIIRAEAKLPQGFDVTQWHELEILRRGGKAEIRLSDAGQYDPVAEVRIDVPAGLRAGHAGMVADDTVDADFDDVTAAKLYTAVTTKVPDPVVPPVDPAWSEEFDGPLGHEWSWLREPAATVDGGELDFPVQAKGLIDDRPRTDQASALLREPPPGDWVVETKVTVPFGESLPHGWPQAGMIAYNNDDEWLSLSYTTRNAPRFVAFGKEMVANDRSITGWAALGPSADTMWLRIRHTIDPGNGEHEYRAATSLDGRDWTWHGSRVLPAGEQPRIGLVAMDIDPDADGEPPGLAATFDYLRFHRSP